MLQPRRKFFSNGEKNRLLHLVGKYSDVLECKTPNSYSNCYKNEVWKTLTKEFNAAAPGAPPCTCKQLQDLHKNLKRKTKSRREGVLLVKTEDPDEGPQALEQSSEDNQAFLKIIACEENVDHIFPDDPFNTDTPAVTLLVGSEERDEAHPTTSTENDVGESVIHEEEVVQDGGQSSRPSKSFAMSRMRRRKFQMEEQLARNKVRTEIDAQLSADRRAQEQHELQLRNLKLQERKLVREERKARREERREEELHALRVKCLEAKIRYYERPFAKE